jgi:hypothetical protein
MEDWRSRTDAERALLALNRVCGIRELSDVVVVDEDARQCRAIHGSTDAR